MWLASDDESNSHADAAEELLAHPKTQAAALDLTLLEVINARSRRNSVAGRLPVAEEIAAITAGRVITLERSELSELEVLCRDHNLSSYDGAYVVAAATRRMKLVSLDMKDLVEPGWAVTPEQALEALAA